MRDAGGKAASAARLAGQSGSAQDDSASSVSPLCLPREDVLLREIDSIQSLSFLTRNKTEESESEDERLAWPRKWTNRNLESRFESSFSIADRPAWNRQASISKQLKTSFCSAKGLRQSQLGHVLKTRLNRCWRRLIAFQEASSGLLLK